MPSPGQMHSLQPTRFPGRENLSPYTLQLAEDEEESPGSSIATIQMSWYSVRRSCAEWTRIADPHLAFSSGPVPDWISEGDPRLPILVGIVDTSG